MSLNTTFHLLSSDYSKSVHLQADRSIEFHTPQGCHHTVRIPRYGRDLKYDRRSAEVLVPAVGAGEKGRGEVFRLNLELGRFMRSYEVDIADDDTQHTGGHSLQGSVDIGSVNTAAIAEESHNLLAFGTSLGTIEFWDPRSKSRAGILRSSNPFDVIDGRQEITAVEFHRSGLTLAAGSSAGLIHIYDLRSPVPLLKKDQGYGFPIQTLTFLTPSVSSQSHINEPKILSADKRIIKIWDTRDGSPWTSVEPAVDLNSVAWCKDSGMLLTANEGRQQHSFFIPQLGPAPKWCSFLDNLVEEMAEDPNDPNAFANQHAGEVYDNYKFLTTAQLKSLNLSHLVGTTSLLRPYMHGYFVAQRLYEEAKIIANPFVWEEERAKRVKEKIESERESRIRGNKKVTTKVNKRLAEKMIEQEEKNERRKARRLLEQNTNSDRAEDPPAKISQEDDQPTRKSLLTDSRFAKLFQDENFAIDETSREFQSLNPRTAKTSDDKPEWRPAAVEEEQLSEAPGSSSEGSDGETSPEKPMQKAKATRVSSATYKRSGHLSQQPQLRIRSQRTAPSRDRSFGSLAAPKKSYKAGRSVVSGEHEITFAPEKKGKAKNVERSFPSHRQYQSRRSASGNVLRKL